MVGQDLLVLIALRKVIDDAVILSVIEHMLLVPSC